MTTPQTQSAASDWVDAFNSRTIYLIVMGGALLPAALWFIFIWFGNMATVEQLVQFTVGPLLVVLPLALGVVLWLIYGWLEPLEALARGEERTVALVAQARRTIYRLPWRMIWILVVLCILYPNTAMLGVWLNGNPDLRLGVQDWVLLQLMMGPVLVIASQLTHALMQPRVDAPLSEIGLAPAERASSLRDMMITLAVVLPATGLVLMALIVAPQVIKLAQDAPALIAEAPTVTTITGAAPALEDRLVRILLGPTIAAFVFLALCLWIGVMHMRNSIRPLNAVTQVAETISRGELRQKPLLISGKDELGQMAHAINKMLASLHAIVAFANQVSDGDLRLRLKGEGDMARAFNRLVATQGELVEQLTETSIQINSGAAEIFATSRESESNATEQASSVEETKRTMKNLLDSSSKIAESAHVVYQNAERTMDNIRLIAERLSELVAHNQKIGELLDFVKEIADRSDLLALNASLEGTRAGEAGRGFSLVAAEMRRLAESVMDSVKDIKQLVADVRSSSQASVLATEEGMKLGNETTESAKMITFITQQQQTGTEQVSRSMDEISELLNLSVAGSKQATSSAEELKNLSQRLQNIIEGFHIEGHVIFETESAGTWKPAARSSSIVQTPLREYGYAPGAANPRLQLIGGAEWPNDFAPDHPEAPEGR